MTERGTECPRGATQVGDFLCYIPIRLLHSVASPGGDKGGDKQVPLHTAFAKKRFLALHGPRLFESPQAEEQCLSEPVWTPANVNE